MTKFGGQAFALCHKIFTWATKYYVAVYQFDTHGLVGWIAVYGVNDRVFKLHNDNAVVSVRKTLISNFVYLVALVVVEIHCASVMNNLKSDMNSKIFKYSQKKVFPRPQDESMCFDFALHALRF